MRVLVGVTESTTLAEDFSIEGTSIPAEYHEYTLNEWDDYALEAAVQLEEAGIADEVVTVTIGPPRAEETIRKALAKGADRAIRIWDDDLAAASLLDVAAKATILAAVVESESPDLVLTGVQAADDAFGGTGVALAEAVEYGWAAVVNALSVNPESETVSVHRELEGGVEELSDVELPAVLTIQTGINEPRYASLRGIRQAQLTEIDTRTLADLELTFANCASSLQLTELAEPTSEGEPNLLEGSPAEQADELAAILAENGVPQ